MAILLCNYLVKLPIPGVVTNGVIKVVDGRTENDYLVLLSFELTLEIQSMDNDTIFSVPGKPTKQKPALTKTSLKIKP